MDCLKRYKRTLLCVAGLAAAMVATAGPGCSGCSGKAPLAYVPQDALYVGVVPSIAEAIKGAGALLDKFKDETPVKMGLKQNRARLVKELGFDPEKPETMEAKGIDPSRGIVASVAADGVSSALVVGVTEQAAMEKYLRETVTKMMGGGATFKEKTVSGVKATLVSMQGSEVPRMAWVHVKEHVVICPRAKDDKVAQHAARLATQEQSIKENRTFELLRGKLGKHHAMLFASGATHKKVEAARIQRRLKTASEWMQKSLKERQETMNAVLEYYDGAALGLRLSGEGATLRGYLAVPEGKSEVLQAIAAGEGDAPDFAEFMGPDALLVGRLSLNTKKLWDKAREIVPPREKRRMYRRLDRIERETKINVEKDVMGQLAGRFAFALFAPDAKVLKKGDLFNIRRPDEIITALPMVAMAQVKSPKKAKELLSTVERVMTREGTDVRARSEGERKTYYIGSSSKPLVSWTLVEDVVVVGTGKRVAKTVTLMRKGGDNALGQIGSSRAKKLMTSEEGAVAYYNLAKTADLVRGLDLPGEIKLMLSSVTSALGKFEDVTWSLEVESEGVLGEFQVRVK